MKKTICAVLVTMFLPLAAQADTVLLNNGDRITGTVVSQNDQQVSIRLPYASSPIQIPRSSVKQVTTAAAASAKKASSKSDSDELKETEWKLSGKVDGDVKLIHNEDDTKNISLTNTLEYSNNIWRYALDDAYYYVTEDDETSSHKYDLKPSLDYFFTPKWFLHNTADYEYNMLADKYMTINLGTGPGYRFWDEKDSRLEVTTQAGVSAAFWHDGVADDDDAAYLNNAYSNDHYYYPFMSVGWDYKQPLWDSDFSLTSKGTYLKYLHQQSDTVILNQTVNFSVGLQYNLTKHVHLGLGTALDWDDTYIKGDDGHKYRDPANKEWRHTFTVGATF